MRFTPAATRISTNWSATVLAIGRLPEGAYPIDTPLRGMSAMSLRDRQRIDAVDYMLAHRMRLARQQAPAATRDLMVHRDALRGRARRDPGAAGTDPAGCVGADRRARSDRNAARARLLRHHLRKGRRSREQR